MIILKIPNKFYDDIVYSNTIFPSAIIFAPFVENFLSSFAFLFAGDLPLSFVMPIRAITAPKRTNTSKNSAIRKSPHQFCFLFDIGKPADLQLLPPLPPGKGLEIGETNLQLVLVEY